MRASLSFFLPTRTTNQKGITISGFISRAQDTKHMQNVAELFDGLRLDYVESEFNRSDEFLYVVRYKTKDPSNSRLTNTTDLLYRNGYPLTGNGFTAGRIGVNGRIGAPEFYVDFAKQMEMTEAAIFKIYSNGSEEVISVLNEKTMKFIKIE